MNRRAGVTAVVGAAMAAASTLSVPAVRAQPAGESCRGTLYLSFDTGNMRHADLIAGILSRHGVRATFFLADEPAWPDRKTSALSPAFDGYWRARVAEGHAFGSHTLRHGRFLRDLPGGAVAYRPESGEGAGRTLTLPPAAVCEELSNVDARFRTVTGRALDPLWRAPGGRTTPNALAAAGGCGWTHVGWAPAGFLGDELPSESHPNDRLLARALANLRDGDIVMAHLGIWSRRDPFAPMLDPLIDGLKRRGFCFATLRERPRDGVPSSMPAPVRAAG